MTPGGPNAKEQIQRDANHHHFESRRGGQDRPRRLSRTRDQRRHLLQVEDKVWWHGSRRHSPLAGAGRRKPTAQAHVRRTVFGASHLERGARKKAVKPAVKRQLIVGLRQEHKLSERQACKIVSLRRSVYRYQSRPNRDQELVKLLLELAQGRPEQEVGKLFKRPATAGP